MFSKVRMLIVPVVASVALWCSAGQSTTDDIVQQDVSSLNMEEGAADGYWGGFAGTFYGGLFCGAYPYLPYCMTGCAYPYVDYGLGWGFGGGWGRGWGGGWGRGWRGWGRR